MGIDSTTTRNNIEKNAQRLNEDCLNTCKNNFLYAAHLNKWRYTLGIISTVAAGLIVLSVSTNFGPTNTIIPLCSVVALLSSAIVTTWNPGKNVELHQRVGNEYDAIQKKAQNFIDVDIPDHDIPNEDLKEGLYKLNNEREILYRTYSQVVIPEWVHKKVKKKLESGEAKYDFESKPEVTKI